jgi:AcrR family transcriptional regulator
MPPTTGRAARSARPRRPGRPTRQEAAALDHDVREHALRLFLERGYDSTSMDAIADAAGTTKASLYARFPSKEALFTDVLGWAVQRPDWPVPEPELSDPDDLEGTLRTIARASLRRALDPSMVKLSRIAIAQAGRFPEVARLIQMVGPWPRRQVVAELLRRHAAAGAIEAPEPDILAEHFLAMVGGMPARLASFGVVRDPDVQSHHLDVAVQLFLRALRPA